LRHQVQLIIVRKAEDGKRNNKKYDSLPGNELHITYPDYY